MGDPATDPTAKRRRAVEYRVAADQRVGMLRSQFQHSWHGCQIVLAIRIDLQGMGEPGIARQTESLADRASLAAIDRQPCDPNPPRRVVQGGKGGGGGGVTAVIDHKNRQPKAA